MWLLLALAWAQFGMHLGYSCGVTSERCIFPSPDDSSVNSCINRPTSLENATDLQSVYYCQTRPSESTSEHAWAKCNGGCFEDESLESPLEFGGDMASVATMCKTEPAKCAFPFTFKGVTYRKCTRSLLGIPSDESAAPTEGESEEKTEESFLWCATETDQVGNMLEGMWGMCDLATCVDDDTGEETAGEASTDAEAIYAEVTISAESNDANVSATIQFQQLSAQGPLQISGQVFGLLPGQRHGFHVHEHPDTSNQCMAAGGHFNPHNVFHGSSNSEIRHAGDFGNIISDSSGVASFEMSIASGSSSLFGDHSLIGRTLVIHAGEDDLGENPDEGSKTVGNAGARLACGIITQKEAISQWNLTLIIIIVLAVIIALLLLLISALICYCCKKKRQISTEKGEEGIPFQNGDMKKKPLYDELSIPFIDASPTPTPKVGRSTERLSFFNRTPSIGRSRGSLSNEDPIKA